MFVFAYQSHLVLYRENKAFLQHVEQALFQDSCSLYLVLCCPQQKFSHKVNTIASLLHQHEYFWFQKTQFVFYFLRLVFCVPFLYSVYPHCLHANQQWLKKPLTERSDVLLAWVAFLKAKHEIKRPISDILRIIINSVLLYNFPKKFRGP